LGSGNELIVLFGVFMWDGGSVNIGIVDKVAECLAVDSMFLLNPIIVYRDKSLEIFFVLSCVSGYAHYVDRNVLVYSGIPCNKVYGVSIGFARGSGDSSIIDSYRDCIDKLLLCGCRKEGEQKDKDIKYYYVLESRHTRKLDVSIEYSKYLDDKVIEILLNIFEQKITVLRRGATQGLEKGVEESRFENIFNVVPLGDVEAVKEGLVRDRRIDRKISGEDVYKRINGIITNLVEVSKQQKRSVYIPIIISDRRSGEKRLREWKVYGVPLDIQSSELASVVEYKDVVNMLIGMGIKSVVELAGQGLRNTMEKIYGFKHPIEYIVSEK